MNVVPKKDRKSYKEMLKDILLGYVTLYNGRDDYSVFTAIDIYNRKMGVTL
ncbi:MAG: hypothetical protein JRJ27_20100 [Deltaproteobacteria bacterium]|nr:hypothetical protein [Deltaproteobacteria bacterium]